MNRRHRAFTLIEIMIAIAIIAILIGIGRVSYSRARQEAQNTATLAAAKVVASDYLVKLSGNYNLTHRWGANYDKAYLNGAMESALENVPYDNVYHYKNPGSGSKLVLDWPTAPSGYTQAAFFITNNAAYSYDSLKGKKTPELTGTVVIWTANGTAAADVFYVDAWGRLSAFRVSY